MTREGFPSSVGEVLEKVFVRLGIDNKMRELNVLKSWDEVVGEHLSKHSQPITIRKGNLFVKVDSSAWLAQLTYFKEKIISEFNRRQGKEIIQDIHLRVGKISQPQVKKRKTNSRLGKARLSKKDIEWIENTVSKIKDN